MDKFFIGFGIGLGAALIDVVLTYKYEDNKYKCLDKLIR